MSLKEIANQVLDIVRQGSYEIQGVKIDIGNSQQHAITGTLLIKPDHLDTLRSKPIPGNLATVSVVDGTTQVIAQKMADELGSTDHLALLNFASARNPGGGFLNGAKAQEEDLCRCSGLYPCLLQCMHYYETNRIQDSLLYTDHMIYSPGVPFFKLRGTGDLLSEPFVASVITAPAPNTRPFLKKSPDGHEQLRDTFLRRWTNVLCLAREQRVSQLLLGAWGCGAFGGDPVMAAETAKSAIATHGGAFERIVFAIPNQGQQSKANFAAFEREFAQ